jgi:hypothetical protein
MLYAQPSDVMLAERAFDVTLVLLKRKKLVEITIAHRFIIKPTV